MSAPAYASDLTPIVTDMASTAGWTALGGGAGGLVAPETDYFIQGNNCISKAGWSAAVKGIIFGAAAGVTVPAGSAVFAWLYFWAPNSLAVEAGAPGGLQMLIGSASNAYKAWDIRGSDTLIYGGWVCGVVDPTIAADDTTGAPGATLQFFGATANVPAAGPSKGQPLGIDAIRYGRDFTCTDGDAGNGYATFAGAATFNDDISRRFGQFQAIDGGYLMQGRFLFGAAGTPVDFRDSNRAIVIARTNKVSSTFNTFEVVNASSNVELSNINITALGTVSRGDWVTTDNAVQLKNTCVFTDMGAFGYLGNSVLTSCTYRRCNLVTQASATFVGCTFDSTNDAARALLSNNPNLISGCSFISSGTKHAIEITVAGTYTISGNTFTGYSGTPGSNPTPSSGSADAAIYNNSGGAVTLNVTDGGSLPAVRNGAGATTTVVSDQVTYEFDVRDESGAAVTGYEWRLYVASAVQGKLADSELDGEETAAASSQSYVYTYTSDTDVVLQIIATGFVEYILRDTLTSANKTIAVVLQSEENI